MKILLFLLFCFVKAEVAIFGLVNLSLKEKIADIADEHDDERDLIKALFKLAYFDDIKVEKTSSGWKIAVVERKFISKVKFFVKNELGCIENTKNIIKISNMHSKIIQPNVYLKNQNILQAKTNIKQYYLRQGYCLIAFSESFEKCENGTYELKITVILGKKINDSKVVFLGLKNLKTNMLYALCSKRPKTFLYFINVGMPEPLEVLRDEESIVEYAKSQGFLDFEIKTSFVETFLGKQTIYFVVHEGEQGVIENTIIKNDIADCDLVFENQIANYKNINSILNDVKNYYLNNYSIKVNVSYSLNKKDIGCDLIVKVESIKSNILKKIIVKGNDETLASVIINKSKLKQGSFIFLEDLAYAYKKIMTLEVVQNVVITPKNSMLDEVSYVDFDMLEICVQEKGIGEIGANLRAEFNGCNDFLDNFGINLYYKNNNFYGENKKVLFYLGVFNSGVSFDFTNSNPQFLYNDIELIYKSSFLNEFDEKVKFEYFEQDKQKGYKVFKIIQSISLNFLLNDYIQSDFGANFIYVNNKKDLCKFKVIQSEKLFPTMFIYLPEFFSKFVFDYKWISGSFEFKLPFFVNNFDWNGVNVYLKCEFSLKNNYVLHKKSGVYLRNFISGGVIFDPDDSIVDTFSSIKVKGIKVSGLYEVKNIASDNKKKKFNEVFKELGGTKYFALTSELIMPLSEVLFSDYDWFGMNFFVGGYCGSFWDLNIMEQDIRKYNLKGTSDFYLRATNVVGIRFNVYIVKLEIGYVVHWLHHYDDKTSKYIIKMGLGSINL